MNRTFKLTGALAAVGAIVAGGACLLGKYILGKVDETVVTDEEANEVQENFSSNVETYTDIPAEEEQADENAETDSEA